MRVPVIPIVKFVGTVSLGLLTVRLLYVLTTLLLCLPLGYQLDCTLGVGILDLL